MTSGCVPQAQMKQQPESFTECVPLIAKKVWTSPMKVAKDPMLEPLTLTVVWTEPPPANGAIENLLCVAFACANRPPLQFGLQKKKTPFWGQKLARKKAPSAPVSACC